MPSSLEIARLEEHMTRELARVETRISALTSQFTQLVRWMKILVATLGLSGLLSSQPLIELLQRLF